MTIKQAIEKAVEGGWNEKTFSAEHLNLRVANTEIGSIDMPLDCVFLDPLFWQALAYGLGWDVKDGLMRCKNYNPEYNEPGERGCFSDKCEYAGYKDFRYEWHRLIDHLAEGKSITHFFSTIN